MPATLRFRGEDYARKRELHVTIASKKSAFPAAAVEAAARGVAFAVAPAGTFRLARKGTRRALVELVNLAGQEDFCARLERELGLPPGAAPRLPSHVTLFTEPGGGGIGFAGVDEMNALSTPIADREEIKALLAARQATWTI